MNYHPSKGLLGQLEDKFLIDDGCWPWIGKRNHKGYGVLYQSPGQKPRNQKAHRVLYELLVGPIPEGMHLDHLCHGQDIECLGGVTCPHRSCVNPAHLEPVSPKENVNRGLSSSQDRR